VIGTFSELTKSVGGNREFSSKNLAYPPISPFNGCLWRAALLSRVGLPKAEMFIWGDEWEYYLRARAVTNKVALALEAKFYHPANRLTKREMHLGRALMIPPMGRAHFYFRNLNHNRRFANQGRLIAFGKFLALGLIYLYARHFKLAFLYFIYGIDGFFDVYALPPSRRALKYLLSQYDVRVRGS
jgi:GT2 family glycosyltransferase